MSFDLLAVIGLLIVLIFGGMRLLYGAWPWEAGKTWYDTREAVEYVATLRRARMDQALCQLADAFNVPNDNSPAEAAAPPKVPPTVGHVWPVHPNSSTGL